MKILCFIFSLFLSISVFSKENFKAINISELEKLLSDKSHPIHLYDANVESTRENIGIIPGAKLIDSSGTNDLQKSLPSDKNAILVFYCANTRCSASHLAAEKAIELGYKNVSVMVDGIYGWQKAQKKIETIRKPSANSAKEITPQGAFDEVKSNKAIIVDVREMEERHEFIANSISAPTSTFESETNWKKFVSSLPKNKTIILHCAAGFRSKKVAEKLANEGYSSKYFKGPDQWKEAGLPLLKK